MRDGTQVHLIHFSHADIVPQSSTGGGWKNVLGSGSTRFTGSNSRSKLTLRRYNQLLTREAEMRLVPGIAASGEELRHVSFVSLVFEGEPRRMSFPLVLSGNGDLVTLPSDLPTRARQSRRNDDWIIDFIWQKPRLANDDYLDQEWLRNIPEDAYRISITFRGDNQASTAMRYMTQNVADSGRVDRFSESPGSNSAKRKVRNFENADAEAKEGRTIVRNNVENSPDPVGHVKGSNLNFLERIKSGQQVKKRARLVVSNNTSAARQTPKSFATGFASTNSSSYSVSAAKKRELQSFMTETSHSMPTIRKPAAQQKSITKFYGRGTPSGGNWGGNRYAVAFGQRYKRDSDLAFRSPEPNVRYEGLRNLGNTCYMNAVLQALMALPPFVSDMMHPMLISRLSGAPNGTVFSALLQVLGQAQSKHGVLNPGVVKEAMGLEAQAFRSYDQQDAHEFFVACLDRLEGDVGSLLGDIINLSSDPQQRLIQQQRARFMMCPVARDFFFIMRHSLTCENCQDTTLIYEPFTDISVDLAGAPAGTSADKLLHDFLASHSVEKTCEKCQHETARMDHSFASLPRILCMHLKRFRPVQEQRQNGETVVTILKDSTPITVRTPLYLNHDTDLSSDCLGVLDWPQNGDSPELKPPPSPVSSGGGIGKAFTGGGSASALGPESAKSFVDLLDTPDPASGTDSADSDLQQALHLSRQTAQPSADDEELMRVLELSRKEAEEMDAQSHSAEATAPRSGEVSLDFDFDDILSSDPSHNGGKRIALSEEKPERYGSLAIIQHTGSTATSGHYVTDVRNFPGEHWTQYDDSVVRDRTKDAVQSDSNKSYLVFYVHEDLWFKIKDGERGQD